MVQAVDNSSFGVFKPVGYVVISLPTAQQAGAAAQALGGLGVAAADVHAFTDREMLARIDRDMRNASSLASVGQEMNLVKAQRALAEQGYHWLVVKAGSDERAQRIADCARDHGAERAQFYGHFIIEELIEHGSDLPQVGESPDRGLDGQDPSGHEAERATLRPRPGTPQAGEGSTSADKG